MSLLRPGDIKQHKHKPEPVPQSHAMYNLVFVFVLQLSETVRASPYYGPAKVTFKPCVLVEATGIGMDIIGAGLTYFSVQCGMTSCRMYCEGETIGGGLDVDNTGRVGIAGVTLMRLCVFLPITHKLSISHR